MESRKEVGFVFHGWIGVHGSVHALDGTAEVLTEAGIIELRSAGGHASEKERSWHKGGRWLFRNAQRRAKTALRNGRDVVIGPFCGFSTSGRS